MRKSYYLLTIDIDWAPDWMIKDIAEVLIKNRVKTTWFVTHKSRAVEMLKKENLFEVGIHPNCLPDSSHGDTEDKVLVYVKDIVPDAVSMRTHGLYQTSNFLVKAARDFGIKNDVSIFLPNTHHIVPHKFSLNGCSLYRIPYFWEDDFEMFSQPPVWNIYSNKYKGPGIKVFNFHPVHIALNSPNIGIYNNLKADCSLDKWSRELVNKYKYQGRGVETMFRGLVKLLKNNGILINEIEDLIKYKK